MRGGASSAATYEMGVNGTGDQQFARVFSQSGPYGAIPGNTIIGAQGQNATFVGAPSAASLSLIQNGGRKRRRGGGLGAVLYSAAAPAVLLGMQQTYRRGRSGKRGTRRRFRRSRRS